MLFAFCSFIPVIFYVVIVKFFNQNVCCTVLSPSVFIEFESLSLQVIIFSSEHVTSIFYSKLFIRLPSSLSTLSALSVR
jgi:hypothetical protein